LLSAISVEGCRGCHKASEIPTGTRAGAGVGANWADYDNDGWLDLFVANGLNTAPNRLYHNNGDGTFTDMAAALGMDFKGDDRQGAWGDIDNDGFLDLMVSGFGKNKLYHNSGNGNHWIVVKPVGVVSNRDAVGARVEVTATIGGKRLKQVREVSAGGSRHSEDSMALEFGLGDAAAADVTITFPSGTKRTFTGLKANQFFRYWERGFTDDPIVPGKTVVKALHMSELRARINALRVAKGLTAYSWTESTLNPGSSVIKAVDIAELRAALAEAYTRAEMPPPSFPDPLVAGSTVVKAIHIAELRRAIIALE